MLLVAMIGAIVLTLRDRKTSRHQSIRAQTERTVGGDAGAGARVARRRREGDRHLPARRSSRNHEAVSRRRTAGGHHGALTVGLGHYLVVSAILLVLGIFGIFLNRKNVIIILMSIELILLAVNLNLVAFSAALGDLVGQVFAMFVLTVAAAEAAIGLAIVVIYFRNRGSIQVEDVNLMKG